MAPGCLLTTTVCTPKFSTFCKHFFSALRARGGWDLSLEAVRVSSPIDHILCSPLQRCNVLVNWCVLRYQQRVSRENEGSGSEGGGGAGRTGGGHLTFLQNYCKRVRCGFNRWKSRKLSFASCVIYTPATRALHVCAFQCIIFPFCARRPQPRANDLDKGLPTATNTPIIYPAPPPPTPPPGVHRLPDR